MGDCVQFLVDPEIGRLKSGLGATREEEIEDPVANGGRLVRVLVGEDELNAIAGGDVDQTGKIGEISETEKGEERSSEGMVNPAPEVQDSRRDIDTDDSEVTHAQSALIGRPIISWCANTDVTPVSQDSGIFACGSSSCRTPFVPRPLLAKNGYLLRLRQSYVTQGVVDTAVRMDR